MDFITDLLGSGITWLAGLVLAAMSFVWFASARNSRLAQHEEKFNTVDEKLKAVDVRMNALEGSVNALNIAIAELKIICTEIRETLKNRS